MLWNRCRRGAGLLVGLVASAALLAGCGEDGLEIAGTYVDQFAYPHVISDTTWDSSTPGFPLLFHIVAYDNDANVLVAENDAGNGFAAGMFSRFTWTTYGGSLYFCQDPYDALSLDDARNAAPPDGTDPSAGGCAGFPWSQLIPQ
jgi:hypothetical protein